MIPLFVPPLVAGVAWGILGSPKTGLLNTALKWAGIDFRFASSTGIAVGNVLDAYVHIQDGRGTNAVLIEIEGTDAETAHEVALHIAFAKPSALSRDEVDPALAETARSGFEELTLKEGKPEQAVPKIVEGRMGSWYAERVLPEQGMFGRLFGRIHRDAMLAEAETLLADAADWADGRITAGHQSAMAKDNAQLPEASPVAKALISSMRALVPEAQRLLR